MNRRIFSTLAGLAGAFLVGACTHTISYPLTEKDEYPGSTIGGVLKVAKFSDDAPASDRVKIRAGKRIWRTNAISGYRDGDRSGGVSNAIARHIEHTGLFEDVRYPEEPDDNADYKLTGKIYDYNAMGQVRPKAEKTILLGAVFGSLPGAALTLAGTAPVKSELHANVELRDLKITEKRSKKLLWSKRSISRRSSRTVHFLKADKKPVYKEADRRLKEVVSEMVQDIGESHAKSPSRWRGSLRSRIGK